MSFVEPAKDFITFCRDLADASGTFSGNVASWRSNVVKFQSMFDEAPDTFEKVFVKFVEDNRDAVDVPITNERNAFDDTWIQIPAPPSSSTTVESSGWSKKTKAARGILLYLNPESPKLANYFLPLSELYALCCRFHKKETNFGNVSHKIVPLVFMKKLYTLLDSVQSTYNFGNNVTEIDGLIESTMEDSDSEDASASGLGVAAPGQFDFSKIFSMEGAMNFLSKIDVGAITAQFANNPEALATAKQVTGLDTSIMTTLLGDIPTVVNALKATKESGDNAGVAQALLESDSVMMIAQKYPDKVEAFKKILETPAAAKEEAIVAEDKPLIESVPLVTSGSEEGTDSADDQE